MSLDIFSNKFDLLTEQLHPKDTAFFRLIDHSYQNDQKRLIATNALRSSRADSAGVRVLLLARPESFALVTTICPKGYANCSSDCFSTNFVSRVCAVLRATNQLIPNVVHSTESGCKISGSTTCFHCSTLVSRASSQARVKQDL